jgi:TetR/AcrR family transcriptional regulator, transcriptional repressor for nem operon
VPRPKAFDPDTVRERVADAFAAHGYRGTSLALLEEASGLGKQSLYNTFGDKQALYLASLECVGDRLASARTAMARADTGRQAIDVFFAGLLQQCADPDPAQHACLVTNGLLEGIDEPAVAAKLRERWQATQALLRVAVERGQRDGSVRRDLASDVLATAMMTVVSGWRVSSRVGAGAGVPEAPPASGSPPQSEKQRAVPLLLSILDPPR